MLPSKAKQDTLVNGYMREESDRVRCNIPLCINQMCFKFYNTILYVQFKGDQLKEFLSTTDGEYWESKSIFIKGIEFVPTLYPDYKTNKIRLEPTINLPPGVNNVIYQTKLSCPETDTFHVVSTQLSSHCGNSYDETQIMSLRRCKDKKVKQLSFAIDIKLLSIEYESKLQQLYHDPSILDMKLKKVTDGHYQWSGDKGPYHNSFIGYIDNKNWAITMNYVFSPIYQYDDEYVFALQLLRLPRGISSIFVKITMDDYTTTARFGMSTHKIKIGYKHQFRSYEIKSKKLEFDLKIKIFKVFTTKYEELQRNEWIKYGIIDGSKHDDRLYVFKKVKYA